MSSAAMKPAPHKELKGSSFFVPQQVLILPMQGMTLK